MSASYAVGIDVGGTFTDFVLVDTTTTNQLRSTRKELTTMKPSEGVLAGTRQLLEGEDLHLSDVGVIFHGTTLTSNALIEKTGATTGLLTTAGIRDALDIRRGFRYDIYDFSIAYPSELVPRDRRLEVQERIDADGEVVTPIDLNGARAAVDGLITERGVDSIAVSFLHSYVNPSHERAVGDLLQTDYPGVHVSLSTDIAPEIREYARTSTTVINAYVGPMIEDYLDTLLAEFQAADFDGEVYLMTGNGGIIDVPGARNEPFRLIESGPAAGVLASNLHAANHCRQDVFSFDMGGTTAKGAVIRNGEIPKVYSKDIARAHRFKEGSGYDLLAPMVDLTEVGLGGGSIARVNELGLLSIGPESAGARPGPACYGRGGSRPTVTDALLLLGYIDPDNFFGGRMQLDRELAERVVREELAVPLGTSNHEAAWQVYDVATEDMAAAFNRYTARRGIDAGETTLVSLGGAGPVHAAHLADKLGIRRVIVPFGAEIGSAFGLTSAPLSYERSASMHLPLDQVDGADIVDSLDELIAEAKGVVHRAGGEGPDLEVEARLDMRHVQQGHEIRVPVPSDLDVAHFRRAELRSRFDDRFQELFGRGSLDYPVEILRVRADVREASDDRRIEWHGTRDRPSRPGHQAIYFGTEAAAVDARVCQWGGLSVGQSLSGPAVIESGRTSVLLPPSAVLTVAEGRDLLIQVGVHRD
jgi:N-methylhydantoinase A/oxoprolinase/acetone carboxylase beta subunit